METQISAYSAIGSMVTNSSTTLLASPRQNTLGPQGAVRPRSDVEVAAYNLGEYLRAVYTNFWSSPSNTGVSYPACIYSSKGSKASAQCSPHAMAFKQNSASTWTVEDYHRMDKGVLQKNVYRTLKQIEEGITKKGMTLRFLNVQNSGKVGEQVQVSPTELGIFMPRTQLLSSPLEYNRGLLHEAYHARLNSLGFPRSLDIKTGKRNYVSVTPSTIIASINLVEHGLFSRDIRAHGLFPNSADYKSVKSAKAITFRDIDKSTEGTPLGKINGLIVNVIYHLTEIDALKFSSSGRYIDRDIKEIMDNLEAQVAKSIGAKSARYLLEEVGKLVSSITRFSMTNLPKKSQSGKLICELLNTVHRVAAKVLGARNFDVPPFSPGKMPKSGCNSMSLSINSAYLSGRSKDEL